MKDLKQLVIYIALSVAVILLLIEMSQNDALNSSVIVSTAIICVVVLPILFAIRVAKKERERQQ